MKPLTLNNRTFLAWKVEEAPKDLQLLIRPGKLNPVLVEWDGQDAKWQIDVPPGTYSEPFLLSQVDEERAKGVVESLMFGSIIGRTRWKDYLNRKQSATGAHECCYTALESFHSWLRANNVFVVNPMGEREPDEVIMTPTHRTVPVCCRRFDKYGDCCNNPDPEQVEDYTPQQNGDWAEWHHYQSQVSKEWIFVEQLKIG